MVRCDVAKEVMPNGEVHLVQHAFDSELDALAAAAEEAQRLLE
jgi:hypothetical protein